jgi:hypothetical protein
MAAVVTCGPTAARPKAELLDANNPVLYMPCDREERAVGDAIEDGRIGEDGKECEASSGAAPDTDTALSLTDTSGSVCMLDSAGTPFSFSTPSIASCCRNCALCCLRPAADMLTQISQTALTTVGDRLKKNTKMPSVDTDTSKEKLRFRSHSGSELMIVGSWFVSERRSPTLVMRVGGPLSAEDAEPSERTVEAAERTDAASLLKAPFLSETPAPVNVGPTLRSARGDCAAAAAIAVLAISEKRSLCPRDEAPAVLMALVAAESAFAAANDRGVGSTCSNCCSK